MIEHVVLAHLIIDDLCFPDGSRVDGLLGGAGTYAALGAAIGSGQRVGLASGVGADLASAHREWLAGWGIDTSALVERGPRTPRSTVTYRGDQTRTEEPVLGAAHFASMAPAVTDLPDTWHPAGAYVFGRHDDPLVAELSAWARRRAAVVLWEIAADSCEPGALAECARLLPRVDILSINLAEARALTCGDAPTDCLRRLRDAGAAIVVLRIGADGALVAGPDGTVAADAAPGPVVDPTGAGNCHSGAFLAALTRTRDLAESAAVAATAAATVLRQYGVPPAPLDLTP